ncbi:MAG: helix-turn-helix transcriptional regulator [Bacilli bacterium]|nr:helix-turn-helix transcriptional regulator [Bacilli bacterium]
MFKDVLRKKGLTCYSLAKRSGLSATTIGELYRGKRDIGTCSFKSVIAISSSLGMTLDEVYRECMARSPIPSELNQYFWDVDAKTLDLVGNMHYIIPRLLQYGGYKGFTFVWKSYTYEEIKRVAMESRNLGPKQAYSLMNYFRLKENQMAYFTKRSGDWR